MANKKHLKIILKWFIVIIALLAIILFPIISVLTF